MNFRPLEPIEIPRQKNGLVITDSRLLRAFWQSFNESAGDALSESIGCYIFSIGAGGGIKPWYVGMAEKQSFAKECFGHHKVTHYNNAVASRSRGLPLLTLVPLLGRTGRPKKPSGNNRPSIRILEQMLIGQCLARNPELLNVRGTRHLKGMVVPGLINSPRGKEPVGVKQFRALIGTKRR